MGGDLLLSWRPQNIVFIGLVLLGYLIFFALLGQVWHRVSNRGD